MERKLYKNVPNRRRSEKEYIVKNIVFHFKKSQKKNVRCVFATEAVNWLTS